MKSFRANLSISYFKHCLFVFLRFHVFDVIGFFICAIIVLVREDIFINP